MRHKDLLKPFVRWRRSVRMTRTLCPPWRRTKSLPAQPISDDWTRIVTSATSDWWTKLPWGASKRALSTWKPTISWSRQSSRISITQWLLAANRMWMTEPGWIPRVSCQLRPICQTNCSQATWHIKMSQWTGRRSVLKHRCASNLLSGCQKTQERINRTRDPSLWTNPPRKRAALSLCAHNWLKAGCLVPPEKETRWLDVPKANE